MLGVMRWATRDGVLVMPGEGTPPPEGTDITTLQQAGRTINPKSNCPFCLTQKGHLSQRYAAMYAPSETEVGHLDGISIASMLAGRK